MLSLEPRVQSPESRVSKGAGFSLRSLVLLLPFGGDARRAEGGAVGYGRLCGFGPLCVASLRVSPAGRDGKEFASLTYCYLLPTCYVERSEASQEPDRVLLAS